MTALYIISFSSKSLAEIIKKPFSPFQVRAFESLTGAGFGALAYASE